MISRNAACLASSLVFLTGVGHTRAQFTSSSAAKPSAPLVAGVADNGSWPPGSLPATGDTYKPQTTWDGAGSHSGLPATSCGAGCSSGPRGCGRQRTYGSCWGLSEEFIPQPLGGFLYAHCNVQVANGIAARLVLYHYDFVDGTDQLNLKGRDRLQQFAGLLCACPAPLIIERTPYTPGLDQARRLTVLNALGQGPAPVPADRVVIGPAPARGLDGLEGEIVFQNLLIQTQSGGTAQGAGGGSVGGSAGLGPNATGRPGQ
jgi:hypothetical protein